MNQRERKSLHNALGQMSRAVEDMTSGLAGRADTDPIAWKTLIRQILNAYIKVSGILCAELFTPDFYYPAKAPRPGVAPPADIEG
jgi:hypothetical protein